MRWSAVLLALGVMVVPGVARAGCPNPCEIGEATVTLEPELECADVRVHSSDCDCGIAVEIGNACELPLDALSFEFRSCGPTGGPFVQGCRTVEASDQGTFEVPIHETGRRERSFTLRYDGGDHLLTVAADVSSFDDGAICSVTRHVGRGGAPGGGTLLVALGALALLRRQRRS